MDVSTALGIIDLAGFQILPVLHLHGPVGTAATLKNSKFISSLRLPVELLGSIIPFDEFNNALSVEI